jgi:carboxyl-terminal processing protease
MQLKTPPMKHTRFQRRQFLALGLAPLGAVAQVPDLGVVAAAIARTLHEQLFDPRLLQTAAFVAVQARVSELAAQAPSKEDFVVGFNRVWREGPISHVRLASARQSAQDLAAHLDDMNVGAQGAQLTWHEDVAVLTVRTMMGRDTIQRIEAAYLELHAAKARAMVIDLRDNEGGAFAVRPLVSHVMAAPFEAGVFTSQRWARRHDAPPTRAQVLAVEPWHGWSIRSFWRDVQAQELTRVRFEPAAPRFEGQVLVLTSRRTASAAELAADALQASGRARLLGERTAGQMLSQCVFDLPHGLHLYLPIADYHSLASGRIEGRGLEPQVSAVAGEALEVAIGLLRHGR